MARWKLRVAHYLNVPGTEWEQKETDRTSGKQARKIYLVPMHLDPENAADHNYPGEIVVCHEGKGQGQDIVFEGKPTPDMIPLDAEAEAISNAEAQNWSHPINDLSEGGFGEALIHRFESMMAEVMRQSGGAVSAKPSTDPTVAQLLEQVAQLTQLVGNLQGRLELEDVAPTPEEIADSEAKARRRV